jgi:hypothetical protein
MGASFNVVVFGFFLGVISSDAQSIIQRDFADYQRQALTEKIFVHTDKETYLSGETLWFSVYVVDGLTHHELALSKVAYVEVLDKDNRPLLQAKVPLENGRGSGSFSIPDISSANYILRAYTRWMRNFEPAYFFEKDIVVLNSFQPNVIHLTETTDDKNNTPLVQFFPEGGQMVENIRSKIAFQATGIDGKGVDILGYIRSLKGDTVTQFKTLKFGIGSFPFMPVSGVAYEAVVTYQGKLSRHSLPVIHNRGYVLNVNTLRNGKIHAIVSASDKQISDTITLFIHTRSKTKLVQATILKDGKGGFLIDQHKLDEGISHFTVFNGAGKPLCERLYFVRPKDQLRPQIKLEKRSFTTRQLVKMSVGANTSNNSPASASLSISVFKIDSTQNKAPINILHYLMLSSDLKGTVESPEYYLTSNDSIVDQATDNLMLTHGWRRFTWNDISERKTVSLPYSPEYEGIVISGTLMRRDSSGAPNENLYLSFPGIHPQLFTAQTGAEGRFEFLVKRPVGHREVVIQAAKNPEAFIVLLNSPFSVEYTNQHANMLKLDEHLRNVIIENSIHSQAKNYFQRQPAINDPDSKDSVIFYGTADKSYILDDYKRFSTMEDVMREYVREITVVTKGRRSTPYVLNKRNEEYFEEDPLVLVDGMPITSTYRVPGMSAADVETLEVVTQRYRLGPSTFNGIVSMRTINGRLGGVEPDEGAYAFDFDGLHTAREFYSPAYPSSTEQNKRIPDFRNVLLWKPILQTSGTDQPQISFYTSDENGSFIIFVQGISSDGIAGSSSFTFEVSEQ